MSRNAILWLCVLAPAASCGVEAAPSTASETENEDTAGDSTGTATATDSTDGTTETSDGGATETLTLTIMSFNIRLGGIGEETQSFVDVVEAAGADVVGFQEAGTRASAIASSLGWVSDPGDIDVAFASRLPIAGSFSGGIRVTLCEGGDVAVANVHLPPYPYGPYDVRDDPSLTEADLIQTANDARASEMTTALGTVDAELASGAPVFMVGDFNEPSHLDWTSEAGAAGLHFGRVVAWPTSLQMAGAGMTDAFRAIRPDEVADVGDTWTPRPATDEVHDRIDFVYFAGAAVTVTEVMVVGEDAAYADAVVDPFPSDHRAIAATFEIEVPVGCGS